MVPRPLGGSPRPLGPARGREQGSGGSESSRWGPPAIRGSYPSPPPTTHHHSGGRTATTEGASRVRLTAWWQGCLGGKADVWGARVYLPPSVPGGGGRGSTPPPSPPHRDGLNHPVQPWAEGVVHGALHLVQHEAVGPPQDDRRLRVLCPALNDQAAPAPRRGTLSRHTLTRVVCPWEP